ncbi:MAG TPA: CocE/NonD family hydrolase [Xanthobacteraceae bacterium]|nr:CocE/NonD family hydrolase [Xanthobacteraceae bacterium]
MPRAEPAAGPQAIELGAEQGELRAQPWLVPSPQPGVLMHTTVFRPPGRGPFPLVIVNHGTTQNAERRRRLPLPEFPALTGWFVRRGYAVAVPQRPGHGATGGIYREDQGGCDDANFAAAGLAAADSIAAAVAYLRVQPFVRRSGVVVVGQSAGGWAALALASRAPAGVRAAINFAGGLGGRSYDQPDNNCAPARLIAAAGEFGRTARIPTLWIYTENDSYFAPRLSGAMAAAFRAVGGKADYELLPAFGRDGHFMAETPGSDAVWGPVVERFLQGLR